MEKRKSKRYQQKKNMPPKITRKMVKDGLEDFMKRGGKITKLEDNSDHYSTMARGGGRFPELKDDFKELNVQSNQLFD